MRTTDELGVGVVGVGTMGELHARVYSELPGVRLIGVADTDLEKAKTIAHKYKCKYFHPPETLFENPDIKAVSIATPDHLHYDLVIAALNAGKHVLVEKPLTIDVSEAEKIVEVAEVMERIVMVNYNNRWGLPYQKAKSEIAAGKIGAPLFCYARKVNNINVPTKLLRWAAKTSCVDFLATHDIDMMLWFFDYPKVEEVYAVSCKKILPQKGIPTPDMVVAVVKLVNGAFAVFECGWIYPPTLPMSTDAYMQIVGEKGVIRIDRHVENVIIYSDAGVEYPRVCLGGEVNRQYQGSFRWALERFVSCIKEGKQPEPSARQALQVVKITSAIHQSIKEGRPIKL